MIQQAWIISLRIARTVNRIKEELADVSGLGVRYQQVYNASRNSPHHRRDKRYVTPSSDSAEEQLLEAVKSCGKEGLNSRSFRIMTPKGLKYGIVAASDKALELLRQYGEFVFMDAPHHALHLEWFLMQLLLRDDNGSIRPTTHMVIERQHESRPRELGLRRRHPRKGLNGDSHRLEFQRLILGLRNS